MNIITPSILYIVYHVFYGIQVEHSFHTLKAASWAFVTPLGRALWIDPPWSFVCKLYLLICRITGISFLVYFGFKTIWYYPFILWVIASIIDVGCDVVVRIYRGYGHLTLLGFFVVPIVGVWMWLAV